MILKIFKDTSDLITFARDLCVATARKAIEERGAFNISLCGGSTPKPLYELLSKAEVDWAKCRIFLGDERMVSPDHDGSNFKMISDALLAPADGPAENVFRWMTETGDPALAAADYNNKIDASFNGEPIFDLTFLGLGDDAHTASLFPYSPALAETKRFAVENWVEKFASYRLTTTFPLINSSRNIAFLVSGSSKAEALNVVLNGDLNSLQYPAQAVAPANGKLYWLVDSDAARLIDKN